MIESVVIAVGMDLLFSTLPFGFYKTDEISFTAESVSFKKVSMPVSMQPAHSLIVDYEYSSIPSTPTLRPSVFPTVLPTSQPSSSPSGQPTSSPTAAPSVSPQPTSHPSSSGPTNTYKPTIKPTPRPSVAPSNEPTRAPSVNPTTTPTVRPTVAPSMSPSRRPSLAPTTAPTRGPSQKATRPPTFTPSFVPTGAPSVAPSPEGANIDAKRKKSDVALVIGGSVIGGLLALWGGNWLLQWFVYYLQKRERKKALWEELMATKRAEDPEQQRIVSETVRRRCAAPVRTVRAPRTEERPEELSSSRLGTGSNIYRASDFHPARGAFANGAYMNSIVDNSSAGEESDEGNIGQANEKKVLTTLRGTSQWSFSSLSSKYSVSSASTGSKNSSGDSDVYSLPSSITDGEDFC